MAGALGVFLRLIAYCSDTNRNVWSERLLVSPKEPPAASRHPRAFAGSGSRRL